MPKIIEDVENRILRAARERLLGGDLSSFSARGIAEDCGIAVGTIYNYYRDKESLMAAIMAQDWQAELQRAGEAVAAALSVEAGILCLYEAMGRFSAVYAGIWASYPSFCPRSRTSSPPSMPASARCRRRGGASCLPS